MSTPEAYPALVGPWAERSPLTDSESFALRRREDKREDARVDTPTTLKSVFDTWHLSRVV